MYNGRSFRKDRLGFSQLVNQCRVMKSIYKHFFRNRQNSTTFALLQYKFYFTFISLTYKIIKIKKCQLKKSPYPQNSHLVREPEGVHVHPPRGKILFILSKWYMCLNCEMGCYQRWFGGKSIFLTGFPGVGENPISLLAGNESWCISVYISIFIENQMRFWYAVFCKWFLWYLVVI